jgi:hypothetical protein
MAVETDLEAAIRLLAEGEERLREQIKLVQTLVRDGKAHGFRHGPLSVHTKNLGGNTDSH